MWRAISSPSAHLLTPYSGSQLTSAAPSAHDTTLSLGVARLSSTKEARGSHKATTNKFDFDHEKADYYLFTYIQRPDHLWSGRISTSRQTPRHLEHDNIS